MHKITKKWLILQTVQNNSEEQITDMNENMDTINADKGREPLMRRLAGLPGAAIEALKCPQVWGFFLSLAVIAVVAIAFFYPDASMGNELRQHDMQQGAAIGHEAQQWMEEHPGAEQPRWTNSLFSGMPTFQISPTYPSNSLFAWISTVFGAGLPSPSNLLFMMMAGMLILLMAMKLRWYYALVGALAWGFSTYFIIIIGAGHIWKFVTLAYIPPTIAGVVMAYRGRWLTGSALAALFAMMQVQSNHVQMTYYFLFVILALVIGYFFQAVRAGRLPRWYKATAALAVAAVLAVCANLPNLYNTYRYSKESMRGAHSELTSDTPADASAKTAGLDRDYITQYSYGRAESFTLLIPNVKGGASAKPVQGQMTALSAIDVPGATDIADKYGLNEAERMFLGYMGQYFGEPESTNGPVYAGALIFALALLGCVIVRGPVKWALMLTGALSVLLALGRNLQWLTDLFIDYVPMYSRFRTVESILVIVEFALPVLAMLALHKLYATPDGLKKYRTAIYWCFGLPALFCLAGWLFPSLYGPAISDGDVQTSQYLGYQLQAMGYPADAIRALSIDNPAIAGALAEIREGMVSADSLRSLIFIILGFGAVMVPLHRQGKPWMAVTLVGILVVADLYPVNKRYLSHESFCTPEITASDPFPLSENDRAILADTAMNYRVMDIPQFQAAAPSYHHKMIGGYHAAKLTRYQDLIDRHLSNFLSGEPSEADWRVLDMLNARYIIGPDGSLAMNPDALGNAWFVDSVRYAAGPDEEMAALSAIDPARTAVADKRFASALGSSAPKAAGDTIFETTYAPDRLTYHARSARGGVAVFSEVFFPWGWEATIDGKPVETGRVNYLLRALRIPAGEHTVEMTFRPASVSDTVTVARIAVIIIYLLCLSALVASLLHNHQKKR